jgi:hypothetical protein
LSSRHHRPDLFDPSHVRLHQDGTPSAAAHLIGDVFRSVLVIQPVDRDVGACGGEFD